jgi:PAS domain S-box-containing protein
MAGSRGRPADRAPKRPRPATEREQAERLQVASSRISEAVNTTRDLGDLFRTIHEIIGELMPARNFYIALYDDRSEILEFPYFVDEYDVADAPRKLGRGLTEYVLRTGQPLLATEAVHEELVRRGEADLVGAPSVAWVGVPLKARDRTIGVLVAQSYTKGIRFGERESDILQFVSSQVAMAIERKRAEEALYASEARLRAILDSSLDAVVTMDQAGVITGWNAAAERVLGWSASDAIGRFLSDTIIPPQHREAHTRGRERFLATGEGPILGRRIEITALHRDGREFPVELTVAPVRLGDAWLFSAFLRDLTEQKRAAELLKQVIDANPNLIFVKDWDGKFTLVNKACAEIYETTVDAMIGKTDADFNPNPEEVEQFLRDDREVIASSRPKFISSEPVTSPRTGKTRWYQTVKVPLTSPDGAAHHVLGVATDMTERKRAEEALRQSEESHRGLVEHATYGIFRSSPAGRFLTVNPALVGMLGYQSSQDVLSLDIARDVYVDPGVRSRVLAGVVEPGHGRQEVTWRRNDGRVITVRLSGRPVYAPGGKIEAYEFIAEDVTGQRALEERLRQAQKMEAVGRLAGGVAHDFNNLLTAILGSTELMLEALPADDPGREEANEIRKAAVRAADLTRQLLAFSRQQVLEARVLDLNALMANLEKMLGRLIGEDIRFRFVPGSPLGSVRADPGQLEQVIVNLAVNARDAMPDGGTLTIETANVDVDEAYAREQATVEAGHYVLLAVTDTGFGMDRETQARLFEPFFTTKALGKGTGLGLATVYGIVKQSGGYIWVYSEPGHGTSFKVYLPRVDAPAESLEPAPASSGVLGGSETVLVAEDEEAVRHLARRVLESRGYTVLVAASGPEALRLAEGREGPIHLLVTDVVMPEMGGRELAQRLVAPRPAMRILFVSGYTDAAIMQQGVLTPGAAFLQKPFTPDSLARKVRDVLDS